MSVHKRPTNKHRTKFSWGYWVTVPSDEFDKFGNPKRKQKTKFGYSTKKEAQKAEKEFLDKFEKGNIELNKSATFNDIIQNYINYAETIGQYQNGTVTNYKGLLKNQLSSLKNVRVDRITSSIIKHWKDNVVGKNSCYRVNDSIKLIKAAFNYAKKENVINVNPFSGVKKLSEPRKLRKRFSKQEISVLLESCKQYLPEYYCLFAISFMTGMRVGEYSALMVNDISFEQNEIYVERQYTRGELKNRNKTIESTRIVHPSEKVLEIIRWHLNQYNIKEGFLFLDKTKQKPVSAKWLSRRFQKLLELNGYPKDYCRVYDLRGEFVDLMHANKVPLAYISKEIGHSNINTTIKHYTQLLDEVSIDANRRMDEALFGLSI